MGEFFRQHTFDPAIILCSPSRRTRQTLEGMGDALSHASEARFPDMLYCTPSETLARTMEQENDREGDILLIGHNPGIGSLAQMMAFSRQKHDPEALKMLAGGYPTCALSVFETQTEDPDIFFHPVWRLSAYFRPEGRDGE